MRKKRIVVSGINLTEGGILSILLDCLTCLKTLKGEYEIIVLVHRKELLGNLANEFVVKEYPLAKKSWFVRCFYEYIFFYFLSKRLKPYLWLSLHDITPNVRAERLAVYCHNPSPFYKVKKTDLFLDKKFTLFTWFYKYLYQINIHKNNQVVVQQNWMREAFQKMYGINNVIVASPRVGMQALQSNIILPHTFIYPTFPRVFKNIEVIGEALKELDDREIKVFVTIDGTENGYAKRMVEKYKQVKSLVFIGVQTRAQVFEYYRQVEGMIFPSVLETWGMPLSEFSLTRKLIFAADLPYARENLSGYENVMFFQPDNSKQLVDLLKKVINGEKLQFDPVKVEHKEPYAQNWQELFALLLQ